MVTILSKPEYEAHIASTRDARMRWWREARFGMFVHYGLYAQLGRNEWAQPSENIPVDEYAQLAETFAPKPGCCREWAKLAKAAGMKYMVLTTRHHEGFSLWDSKANPFNSVNYGPKRDIVREFVEVCREFDLKIGFYTSLMDWRHPDGAACAYDNEARRRFLEYIEALNTELLTQYGKIDILWYDVALPMQTWEGWDSLARNQRMRALMPDIIINNRSRLDEDFGTPEGKVIPEAARDWEACMTFNDISWGYVDQEQAVPYAYTAPRIIRMLHTCARGAGNLLLNIGPAPDGSVPSDAIEPLTRVGEWLKANGDAVYGIKKRMSDSKHIPGNGVTGSSASEDGKRVYLWNWIWPHNGQMGLGGLMTAPISAKILATGEKVDFEVKNQRVILKNLPAKRPDDIAGVTVIELTFDREPKIVTFSLYPQFSGGEVYKD